MKRPWESVLSMCLALAVLMATPAFAEEIRSPIPFGGYRHNGKCGCYGAKAAIKTAEEARKVIEAFLVGHDLRIGAMLERPRFFKAELVDGNGSIRDLVIVDKLNGRVRSIY